MEEADNVQVDVQVQPLPCGRDVFAEFLSRDGLGGFYPEKVTSDGEDSVAE